eukprot:scpid35180/ scgid1340/ N-acetylgalactosamine-6-sulfatase; Chondroitinsulfatase; Galactose-6-sulfate sulfatase; N-acetylgalactosamine-6-sulfate sulfatase
MAGSAYVFAVLLLTNLLSSWEAFADQPHSAESLEQVLHHAPPPRSLYRASGSERRYGRAPGDTRPNFVIFFPDETRAESIGAYGHPFVRTPNLDSLAQQGTLFKQAHVLHTQCAPSRCAIITGRYMHVLGHRTQNHLVQDYEPNYFRLLKDSGYHVLWHGKNDMFSQTAFNLSVSDWDGTIGVPAGQNAFKFGEPGYYSFKFNGSSEAHNSTKIGDYNAVVKTLDFINNNPPEPFIVFLPGIGAHPPYGAPKGFHDM